MRREALQPPLSSPLGPFSGRLRSRTRPASGRPFRGVAADECGNELSHVQVICTRPASGRPFRRLAADECANELSHVPVIKVDDRTPPDLVVPSPRTLECNAPGGLAGDDPQVLAWLAEASASDACGAVTLIHDAPALLAAGCSPGAVTTVSFTAVDECGNETVLSSSLSVVDLSPPEVEVSSEMAAWIWPPNHAMVELDRSMISPVLSELCGSEPASWRYAGCASSQPDDGLGDGSTEADCAVSPDGSSVQVRAERSGTDGAGRSYRLFIVAEDACGNASAPVPAGTVLVPHSPQGMPPALRIRSTGLGSGL